MSIPTFLSKAVRSMSGRPHKRQTTQGSAELPEAYILPSPMTDCYTTSVWVKDYNCGVYLRVPV